MALDHKATLVDGTDTAPSTRSGCIRLVIMGMLWLLGCSPHVVRGPDSESSADASTEVVDFSGSIERAQPDLWTGKDTYQPCRADTDCHAGLRCREIGDNGEKQCAQPCSSQMDCATLPASYCSPARAGETSGFCLPQSANHCAACSKDSECGPLAVRCVATPGDSAPACHVDCSLSGRDACPPDYECLPFTDGTNTSKLCQPKAKICADSLGGFCERNAAPQSCARRNQAGSCNGQRSCLPSKRYDRCNAENPQYKRTCDEIDRTGCSTSFAPGIANSKQNCGWCGNRCGSNEDCCGGRCAQLDSDYNCGACGRACTGSNESCCSGSCTRIDTATDCGWCGHSCPGVGLTGTLAQCADPVLGKCSLSCTVERGMTTETEYYDPDGKVANGCEVKDVAPPGHDPSVKLDLGAMDCYDWSGAGRSFSARLPSDKTRHVPAISGFDSVSGSAPDFFRVFATGGAGCVNDYWVRITTSGGSATNSCYKITIRTDKITDSRIVSGSGVQVMSGGSSSYSDRSTIDFKVEKICDTKTLENVSYTVDYNL